MTGMTGRTTGNIHKVLMPWSPYRIVLPACLVGLLLAAGMVSAKVCGDDVNGVDVQCACGDVVASTTTLDADPVVSSICPSDGLVLRAPDATASVTLDLAGHTLTGSGQGIGLWVLDGGPGGARIISTGGSATIAGFRDGIAARGQDSVALIDGVTVDHSVRDGIRLLDIQEAMLRNTEALDSGRDGFLLGGRRYVVTNTRALRSKRNGYNVMGADGEVGRHGEGNLASESGRVGFAVTGKGHRIVDCVASRSVADGVRLGGGGHNVTGCLSSENGESGVSGRGMQWRLAENQAVDNGEHGIFVTGAGMIDAGGNIGRGNRGRTRGGPGGQCEIGGDECAR